MVAWWAFIQILYTLYISGRGLHCHVNTQPITQSFSHITFHLLGLSFPWITGVLYQSDSIYLFLHGVLWIYRIYRKISCLPGEFWWKCILPWWKVMDVWPCDNLGVLLLLIFKICFITSLFFNCRKISYKRSGNKIS